ncbi:Ig-like domain-containing protein [Streptomyces sp. NBC_00224]|uniref:Ig-like domain-containing protein n=1 Tax=Streptomyces sp. NBC_00060 TaxID=2975636 RepID=A0AAU2HCW4_9ACTN
MRRHTPPRRRPVRNAVIAGTAVLAAALTACSGGSGGSGDGKGGAADLAGAKKAQISVNLTGQQAKAGEPVKVTLASGKLQQVTVTDAKGGKLAGKIAADGRTWTSDRVAAPGSTYAIEAKDDKGSTAKAGFATVAADKVNKLSLAPGKDTTVGVAQPLSIVFDHPVKNKAAVEKQLKVTTSDNTVGSWGWMEDYSGKSRVDWRPKDYWKAGTKVTLEADLNGVDSGGGWFVKDYKTGFTVGKNQVVKVDLDNHRLKLYRDGAVVKEIPVSGGTPGGDKRSWRGKAVLMSKEGTINMNSETVGLGDAYNKMVDYSMRLTWSGMYAHAAPWNAAYFGNTNHSSGCIGMSDANAKELYGTVQVGDPFEIVGDDTKGPQAVNNGYGEWNLSWEQWQKKSALTGASTAGTASTAGAASS